MRETNVAVILSGREQFSPYFGGAVARWTYEVYSRAPGWLQATVFGEPVDGENLYDLRFHPAKQNWLPNLCSRVPYLRRYEDLIWLRQLMPHLRKHDLVHVQNRPHWAPLLRKLGYTGKIIGHLHNSHLAHYPGERLDELAHSLDCIVSCSDFIASTFVERSAAMAARSTTVYNGVNRAIFHPSGKRASKRLFFVGRIDAQKGVLPLLQAFERVVAVQDDVELVIGGATGFGVHQENEYVNAIQVLAERLKSEKQARISFPGYIDHYRELPRYFQEATLAIFPSVFEEPFGMVICEAMACGTPVIATRRGGIPEVIGNAGLLIDSADPILLADAILKLLNDETTRAELSRKSLIQASRFDWRKISDCWAQLISSVAEGRFPNKSKVKITSSSG